MDLTCDGIRYKIFNYSMREFGEIDIPAEVANWKLIFEAEASVSPISPIFAKEKIPAEPQSTRVNEPSDDFVFIIIYRFLGSAKFVIPDMVDEDWTTNYQALLHQLGIASAVEFMSSNEISAGFKFKFAEIENETMLAFYKGKNEILHGVIDDLFGTNSDQASVNEKSQNSEGNILTRAVKSDVAFSGNFQFSKNVQLGGFLYLISIESDEVVLVEQGFIKEAEKNLGRTTKPIIEGIFWQEDIAWNYSTSTGKFQDIEAEGSFSFQLLNYDDLDGYDVDPCTLSSAVVGHATDGESEKILGICQKISGGIVWADEDDDFFKTGTNGGYSFDPSAVNTLKIYCQDEATQREVISWLADFWSEEVPNPSTWNPDPQDGGTWGIFADGANQDLYDDLMEMFEGRLEADWE